MTPLQKIRKQKLAKIEAEKTSDTSLPTGNAYEMMLIQLTDHRKQLSQTQSMERKAEIKARFLPEYEPYIAGIIEADQGMQDEVLMTIMLWHIDVGDIAGAMPIAEYALRHDLKTPERFNRDTATLIAEEVAEISMKTETPDIPQLENVLGITAEKDMPDQVRAKLHKAIGLAYRNINIDNALMHLNRALQLHEKCGVKKIIEELVRAQKKAVDENQKKAPTPATTPPDTKKEEPKEKEPAEQKTEPTQESSVN